MGYYGVEYERVLYPWLTLFIAPTFTSSAFVRTERVLSSQSFELAIGVRGFLGDNAPKGFWGSAQVGLGYGSATFSDTGLATGPGATPGLTAGYTFLIARRVPISLGAGIGYGLGPYLQGAPLLLMRVSSGLAF